MGGPHKSNGQGLLGRAFVVYPRTRLAISICSRQSGSVLGGAGDNAGKGIAESNCRLLELVSGFDAPCISRSPIPEPRHFRRIDRL